MRSLISRVALTGAMLVVGAASFAQTPTTLGLRANTSAVSVGGEFSVNAFITPGSTATGDPYKITGVSFTVIFDPTQVELLTRGNSTFAAQDTFVANTTINSLVNFRVGGVDYRGYTYQGTAATGAPYDSTAEKTLGTLRFKALKGASARIAFLAQSVANSALTNAGVTFSAIPAGQAGADDPTLNKTIFPAGNMRGTNLRTQIATDPTTGFTLQFSAATVTTPAPPAALIFAGGAVPMLGLLRRRMTRRK